MILLQNVRFQNCLIVLVSSLDGLAVIIQNYTQIFIAFGHKWTTLGRFRSKFEQ